MITLFLSLACTTPSKSDSGTDSPTNDSQVDSGTDSQVDSDSATDSDSGTDSNTDSDSGTDTGEDTASLPAWAFTDERSLVSAIEPAAAPAYIAGLLENWLKYGEDGPHCPDIVDGGGGTIILDGTSCTSGSIEGKVTLSGLVDKQIPTGTPVTLEWDNFGSIYGLYLVHGVTGSQVFTRNSDGTTRVQTTEMKMNFDVSLPRLVPSQVQWSGNYNFSTLDSTEGPYHSYGTVSGHYSSTEYGELEVSWNYKFTPSSCEEGFYYPAAGLWTGATALNVTWDGDSKCDGCVPYLLDKAAGSFCK